MVQVKDKSAREHTHKRNSLWLSLSLSLARWFIVRNIFLIHRSRTSHKSTSINKQLFYLENQKTLHEHIQIIILFIA